MKTEFWLNDLRLFYLDQWNNRSLQSTNQSVKSHISQSDWYQTFRVYYVWR